MRRYYLYIVLTRTNTVLSRLIQWATKDEYTHASISLDEELYYMYSFGRRYAYNPFIGNFNQEDFNQGAYKFCKTLPGIIMRIEVSKQQHEKVKELLEEFILNSERYKYNYKGLIYGLFNKEVYCNNRFLCSEFVYYILNESGVVDFKTPRNLVRPQSFMDLESEIIYRGNLRVVKEMKLMTKPSFARC